MLECLLLTCIISSHYAELVGLSLSYGLSLNSALFMAIWTTCFVENKMVSVERIKQFLYIPSEAKWRIDDCLDDENWPTKGGIDLIDLKVRFGLIIHSSIYILPAIRLSWMLIFVWPKAPMVTH